MQQFVMPALGADMRAGTVVRWRKRPGDAVHRGDTIAEVDTDKGVIDVEVFLEGVLEEILVPVGRKVDVGTAMATIREPGEVPPAAAVAVAAMTPAGAETGEERPRPAAGRPPAPLYGPGLAAAGRLRMSPSARRLARELGVDPALVTGTGPGAAITRADVARAAGPQAGPPSAAETEAEAEAAVPADRLVRMRHAIAAAMARSKREIPHYYLRTTIDMGRASRWLAEENERRSPEGRLLVGALLLKATALAVAAVPEMNAAWQEGRLVPRAAVHVGVAVSLRHGGLVILTLHDTATRGLEDLMRDLRDLTARARSGRMRSSDLADSTITVTSLGDRGVESVYGVIYPPQVAIVGFGSIVDRPWAVDGGLFVRPVVTATLAADHRASDGHRGGLFLEAIDRLLQEPGKL